MNSTSRRGSNQRPFWETQGPSLADSQKYYSLTFKEAEPGPSMAGCQAPVACHNGHMTTVDELVRTPLTGAKVLVVDDEPELRRVFRRTLAAAGFQVTEAADGGVGLELARRGDFDVVVSDLRMGGMSGLELLDRLSTEAPDLPVLIVSGSATFVDAASARAYGAFDYLQKPVELADLRRRTASAIELRRARRQIQGDLARELAAGFASSKSD